MDRSLDHVGRLDLDVLAEAVAVPGDDAQPVVFPITRRWLKQALKELREHRLQSPIVEFAPQPGFTDLQIVADAEPCHD